MSNYSAMCTILAEVSIISSFATHQGESHGDVCAELLLSEHPFCDRGTVDEVRDFPLRK